MLILLAQAMQVVPPDQIMNLLQFGALGLCAAILLIFIPSVLGFVWLILKQQGGHVTNLIESNQEATAEVTKALQQVVAKLDGIGDKLSELQYLLPVPHKTKEEAKAKLLSLVRGKKDGNNISSPETGSGNQRTMGPSPDAV